MVPTRRVFQRDPLELPDQMAFVDARRRWRSFCCGDRSRLFRRQKLCRPGSGPSPRRRGFRRHGNHAGHDAVRSRVMGAWDASHDVALVIALVLGGFIVPALGPRGAYVVGGVTGLIGTALLVPLLRWLPDRTAARGRRLVEPLAVEPLVPGAVAPVVVPADPS